MPCFTGYSNSDGVAISADGVTWHRLWNVVDQPTAGVWAQYSFDLVAAANAAGIALNSNFKIKFQQFDDNPMTTDGRGWDDIVISATASDVDWYRFTLGAGESASIELVGLSAGASVLQLVAADGTVLANGATNAVLGSQEIAQFVAPAAGTYYLKTTTASATVDYNLLVTRNAAFDRGGNHSLATAQQLDASGVVLGRADAASDYYMFQFGGGLLDITTATPGDGPGLFDNNLDPALELYDSGGNLIAFNANGAADGRNARIFTNAARGVYTIRVIAAASTSGEYLLSVPISAVALAPEVTPAATLEDVQSTSGLVLSRNAANGAEVTHFKITGITGGTLYQNDGEAAIVNGQFITYAQGQAGLRFTPAANYSGTASFQVWAAISADEFGVGDVATTAQITIAPVNDAPSFTAGPNQAVDVGLGSVSVTGWATNISSGPGDGSQALSFQVTNDNGSLFSVGPAIDSAGNLTYTLAGVSGTAIVSVTLQDDGGTADGGVNTSPVQTFTITVAAAPTITAISDQTINEDGSTTVTFTVADPDTPLAQLIVSASGGDAVLLPPASLVLTDLGGGSWQLVVTPPANQYGSTTVTVGATDGLLSTGRVFTLTVNAVNDVPSFTKGADRSHYGPIGPQTVANWAAGISAGPNESGQALTFHTTNDNPALFAVAPTIAPDGTLTYTGSGISGTAVVTVRLADDGGTSFGGVDTSATQTFQIRFFFGPEAGTLDPTFDGDGIRNLQSPYGAFDLPRDVARQTDGKYLAVGLRQYRQQYFLNAPSVQRRRFARRNVRQRRYLAVDRACVAYVVGGRSSGRWKNRCRRPYRGVDVRSPPEL